MALRQFPKLLLGRSQFQALVGQRSWSSFCRLGDAAGDLAGGDVLVGGGGGEYIRMSKRSSPLIVSKSIGGMIKNARTALLSWNMPSS